jgi:hypothetical protein
VRRATPNLPSEGSARSLARALGPAGTCILTLFLQLPGLRTPVRELALLLLHPLECTGLIGDRIYDGGNTAYREDLITHVRATLAYLETNHDAIAAERSWWPSRKAGTAAAAKTDEVAVKTKPAAAPVRVEPTTKPKWLN